MVHKCDLCNYSTDRLFNYNKHINSKKHKSKEISHKKVAIEMVQDSAPRCKKLHRENIEEKNIREAFVCEYCKKIYHHHGTLNRHLRTCKDKKQVDQISKDQLIAQLIEKNERMEDEMQKKDKEKNKLKDELIKTNYDLKETNHELLNLVNQMNEKEHTGTTINNYNMFYVINNFTNAHNIEDLMTPQLTEKEIKYIKDRGAVSGTYQLIKDRCIEEIDISDRPFHCIDISRDKYLMRSKDNWSIDSMGNQILDVVFPKVRPLYDLNVGDTNKLEHNANQLTNLENGRKRIIKELNNDTMLKNNMKEKDDKPKKKRNKSEDIGSNK